MAERSVIKQVPNAVEYSDGTILLKELRASYPHVLVAKGGTDADGKPIPPSFSITGLMPKKTHLAAKNLLKEKIDSILAEHKIAGLPAERMFLRNGNLAGKPDYVGNFTVSAREKEERPPSVRDRDKKKLTRDDAAKIFGGCWVNMLIRPWWQANKFGKRVNASLVAVQLLRVDDAFGEGRISEDAIDESFDDESGGGWVDDDMENEAADL